MVLKRKSNKSVPKIIGNNGKIGDIYEKIRTVWCGCATKPCRYLMNYFLSIAYNKNGDDLVYKILWVFNRSSSCMWPTGQWQIFILVNNNNIYTTLTKMSKKCPQHHYFYLSGFFPCGCKHLPVIWTLVAVLRKDGICL